MFFKDREFCVIYTFVYYIMGEIPGYSQKIQGGVMVKQLRIVYNTGELSQTGRPIVRRNNIDVEDSVDSSKALQIAQVIGDLTNYTVQEVYLIVTTQVM